MSGLHSLLFHHRDRARRAVPYNAIANCHAMYLESIVLHDEPGNRVRMFVAKPGHTLWRNGDSGAGFSIAIHPHHCDIHLVGLFGGATNHVYAMTPNPAGDFHQMRYRSAITQGEAKLEPSGARADMHLLRAESLSINPFLRAHELHTIHLHSELEAAWLVIEGASNPSYEQVCWTNEPAPDLSELYKPMDALDVSSTLAWVLSRMGPP